MIINYVNKGTLNAIMKRKGICRETSGVVEITTDKEAYFPPTLRGHWLSEMYFPFAGFDKEGNIILDFRPEIEAREEIYNLTEWRSELLDESGGYKTAWIENIENRLNSLEWALQNPEFLPEILEDENWKKW